MELLKQLITRILGSGLLSTALVLVRAVTVLMVLYVIWRCYTSFKKGQRRKDPVVMLEDAATGAHFPVLYWENSIGRSRSCDIQIPDNSVSRPCRFNAPRRGLVRVRYRLPRRHTRAQ